MKQSIICCASAFTSRLTELPKALPVQITNNTGRKNRKRRRLLSAATIAVPTPAVPSFYQKAPHLDLPPQTPLSSNLLDRKNSGTSPLASTSTLPSPPSSSLPPPTPTDSLYPFTISSSSSLTTLTTPDQPPIARLAHGLHRVLFSPGIHFLKDPRQQGVINFHPTLSKLPTINEFEMEKLPAFIKPSEDEALAKIAKERNAMFVGSTSSCVPMLCQIYIWLSRGKPLNLKMLPAYWSQQPGATTFSAGQRLPASVVVHHRGDHYAIDADKSFDLTARPEFNVLAEYGHLMEKILCTEALEFKGFLKGSPNPAPSEANNKQAYSYLGTDNMILRSQLDAHHPSLPNKTFDVKTRGTAAIRMDRLNYVSAAGYEIDRLHGPWRSFDREYYDLIRSAFLKYQFQARIGSMDGCFLAFHNTQSFHGFSYIPLSEMDEALFTSTPEMGREVGDKWFNVCVGFLDKVLREAKEVYKGSFKLTVEAPKMERGGRSATRSHKKKRSNERSTLRVFVQPENLESLGPEEPTITLLEFDYEPPSRSSPSSLWRGTTKPWDVSYSITSHPSSSSSLSPSAIESLFTTTRKTQQMFSSLWLPIGVTEKEVIDAQTAVREGKELGEEERELVLRFPEIEGVSFRDAPKRKMGTLGKLRSLAKDGNKRRRERGG